MCAPDTVPLMTPGIEKRMIIIEHLLCTSHFKYILSLSRNKIHFIDIR